MLSRMDAKFLTPYFSAPTSADCCDRSPILPDPRRQSYLYPTPLLPGYTLPMPPPLRPIVHSQPQLLVTPSPAAGPVESEPGACLSPDRSSLSKPKVTITEAHLWKAFAEAGNEMIVTKPGRRLFPTICVSLAGLQPNQHYDVVLRLSCADKYRYKFLNGLWQPVGESDILHNEERMEYTHPNSPNLGEIWMKKPVSFKALKITHDSHNTKLGNILLHTMHKYVAEVDIIPTDVRLSKTTVTLHETTFIAVTSYQSSTLTKLKIDNNPFAKGFRDKQGLAPLVYSPTYLTSMQRPYPFPPFIPQPFCSGLPHLSPRSMASDPPQTQDTCSSVTSDPPQSQDDKDSGCYETPSPPNDP